MFDLESRAKGIVRIAGGGFGFRVAAYTEDIGYIITAARCLPRLPDQFCSTIQKGLITADISPLNNEDSRYAMDLVFCDPQRDVALLQMGEGDPEQFYSEVEPLELQLNIDTDREKEAVIFTDSGQWIRGTCSLDHGLPDCQQLTECICGISAKIRPDSSIVMGLPILDSDGKVYGVISEPYIQSDGAIVGMLGVLPLKALPISCLRMLGFVSEIHPHAPAKELARGQTIT